MSFRRVEQRSPFCNSCNSFEPLGSKFEGCQVEGPDELADLTKNRALSDSRTKIK